MRDLVRERDMREIELGVENARAQVGTLNGGVGEERVLVAWIRDVLPIWSVI